MPHPRPVFLIALAPLLLGGCLAKTALDIATAPVKIASKAVDLATTSQSEADEARGREIRRREEQLGKLEREHDKLMEKCLDGSDNACRDAVILQQQIQASLPAVPIEPRG